MLHFPKQCLCLNVYSLIAALHQSLQFKVNLIVHICTVLLTNMLFVIELLSISLVTSVSGHLLIHCQSGSFPFALLFPTYFLPCSLMVGCLSAVTESCIVSQQFSVLPFFSYFKKFYNNTKQNYINFGHALPFIYYFYSCPLILLWIAFMRSIFKILFTFSSLVLSFLTLQ